MSGSPLRLIKRELLSLAGGSPHAARPVADRPGEAMNDALMNPAYTLTRQHYRAAMHAVFEALDSEFSGAEFDEVFGAGSRGMRLRLASLDLARKVWSRNVRFEKAREILGAQFPGFPEETRERALSEAYSDMR